MFERDVSESVNVVRYELPVKDQVESLDKDKDTDFAVFAELIAEVNVVEVNVISAVLILST